MPADAPRRLVVLATSGPVTAWIVRALADRFADCTLDAVYEPPVPAGTLLRRRARRLGWGPVAGQALFMGVLYPLLCRAARHRIAALARDGDVAFPPLPPDRVRTHHVASVNTDAARPCWARSRRTWWCSPARGSCRRKRSPLSGAVHQPARWHHAGLQGRPRRVLGARRRAPRARGRDRPPCRRRHRYGQRALPGHVCARARRHLPNVPAVPGTHRHSASARRCGRRARGPARRAPQPPYPSRLHHHPALWGYLSRRLRYNVR